MLGHGYSCLHVKAVDQDRRILTGMASTPTPDRGGDIVEPKGVRFTNPLPLLLYHDTKRPVGTVKFLTPTADGIPFEAQIADIPEAGPLRDRVEEAWQSVKNGLLRGVSIGYRILQDGAEIIRETGGLRLKAIEVFELSLVAVPMNAEATIAAIKSADAASLAALSHDAISPPVLSPAVAGITRGVAVPRSQGIRSMKKTIADQIRDLESTLGAKTAEWEAVQTKVSEEGRVKDESEREQFNTLKGDIKSLTQEIADLREMETVQKAAAVAPAGTDPAAAAATRAPFAQVQVRSRLEPGQAFARAVICKMYSYMHHVNPVELAKQHYRDNPEIGMFLQKATVAGGTTTDSAWAAPLVYADNLVSEFIEFLRPQTIIGKFGTVQNGVAIPALTPVPFNIRIPRQTSGGTGYWVGEGKPKPMTKFDFDTVSLAYTKVAALAVITKELVRFSNPNAELLVRNQLAAAAIARIDTDMFDPAKAVSAGVNPASLTNGLTPLSSAGTAYSNVVTDVQNLLAPFLVAKYNPQGLVLVMPSTLALALSLMQTSLGTKAFPNISMNGGTLEGIPVVTSQYVANESSYGNMVIAVHAPSIGLADDREIDVMVSGEASLQMADDPTNASSDGTATTMVSMFQTNSLAILAERYINWVKMRSTAVKFMDDVNWGSIGSPV